jgi:WD40 repeat protein
LKITHDGLFVACGDWNGNIRIYDLLKETLDEIKCIEAHESEILSIDFTR